MTALNPSSAFQARCSVVHNPPDPPFFLTNHGFLSVEHDTSVIPAGAYLLQTDPILDLAKNAVIGTYQTNDPVDYGVLFFGHTATPPPIAPGRFSVVRFQVLPGNTPLNGPFEVVIVSTE